MTTAARHEGKTTNGDALSDQVQIQKNALLEGGGKLHRRQLLIGLT